MKGAYTFNKKEKEIKKFSIDKAITQLKEAEDKLTKEIELRESILSEKLKERSIIREMIRASCPTYKREHYPKPFLTIIKALSFIGERGTKSQIKESLQKNLELDEKKSECLCNNNLGKMQKCEILRIDDSETRRIYIMNS